MNFLKHYKYILSQKAYNLMKIASHIIVVSFPIPQIPLKSQINRSDLNVEANLIFCVFVQW